MNGNSIEGFKEQIADVRAEAALHGRTVKFAANAFVINRPSFEEAEDQLREIVAHADDEAVRGFRDAVAQAGRSSREGKGMWSDSSYKDLVQYNDGFKTGLIGTPSQIAARIQELDAIGVDLVLTGYLHFIEEVEAFGKEVIPLVRALPSLRDGAYLTQAELAAEAVAV
jgi:FMNH2-dependent dimethyl sulfone monooxygenase